MRIAVHAVGRMKAGPERELAERYFGRFAKSGPAIGLEFAGVTEVAESRAKSPAERRREERRKLEIPSEGTVVVLLDEAGKNLSSEALARRTADWRDANRKEVVFAIGGADGHDPELRSAADLVLSFGAQTWPHQIVRVMLAEQLYRAATILAGHPYHRG